MSEVLKCFLISLSIDELILSVLKQSKWVEVVTQRLLWANLFLPSHKSDF